MPSRLSSIATLTLLGSCAIEAPRGWEAELEQKIVDRATDFPNVDKILPGGVASTERSVGVQQGDELLFGICLDADGERTIWYLDVRVLAVEARKWLEFRGVPDFESRVRPDPESFERMRAEERAWHDEMEAKGFDFMALASEVPIARIRVEAFDGNARSLGHAESDVSATLLERGLLDAFGAGYAQRDVMRGRVALGSDAEELELTLAAYEDVQTVGRGVAGCERFLSILRSNPVTKRILFQVIALPSLWSMLTNLGVSTKFEVDFFASQRVDPDRLPSTVEGPVWSAPTMLRLNGQPALLARIVAGSPASPHGLAAGIVGVVGRHPGDPDRSLHVQLLASRSGTR